MAIDGAAGRADPVTQVGAFVRRPLTKVTTDQSETQDGYCPYCDCMTTHVQTVPWQQNICAECGNDLPEDGPE